MLSKAYAEAKPDTKVQIPTRMTKGEKIKLAGDLRKQGFSLGKIAKIGGVSTFTVKNYVDGYPYKRNNNRNY